jgi:hypothetical protein
MKCTIPSQTPSFPFAPSRPHWSGGVNCSALSRLDMRFTAGRSAMFRFTLYWDLFGFLFLFGLLGVLPGGGTVLNRIQLIIQRGSARHVGSFPFPTYLLPTSSPIERSPNQASVSWHLHFTAQQPPICISPTAALRVYNSGHLRSRSFGPNIHHQHDETKSTSFLHSSFLAFRVHSNSVAACLVLHPAKPTNTSVYPSSRPHVSRASAATPFLSPLYLSSFVK